MANFVYRNYFSITCILHEFASMLMPLMFGDDDCLNIFLFCPNKARIPYKLDPAQFETLKVEIFVVVSVVGTR